MPEQAERRRHMVETQLAARGITDARVLEAMGQVPREVFVPEALRGFAYDDTALPIEAGQTISQPYIVALMIAAAQVEPGDLVLEVGAGSGYAAAVLGAMGAEVLAIEWHPELVALARERMLLLGHANVDVEQGDGTRGMPELAPFDAIVVSAGGPDVPGALLDQLAPDACLIMPVGPPEAQQLLRVTRPPPGGERREDLGPVRFVPLRGAQGWADDDGQSGLEP